MGDGVRVSMRALLYTGVGKSAALNSGDYHTRYRYVFNLWENNPRGGKH